MKFKVGDRVRVTEAVTDHRQKHIGKIYTVQDVNARGLSYFSRHNVNYYSMQEEECHYIFYEDELELVSFTKSDLKDGMVVECSNGKRKMLINGAFRGTHCYTAVSAYTDTLECRYNESTINKVYTSKALSLSSYFDDKNLTLIWERPEEEPAKKMTVTEIEKELGYKVEIVSEN